ncbi:NAD(P)H nitroreductase [Candidatus Atribacteria bacterium HGW-Atribacteria-1]|nr:MAG: NAD(P)H nitroreductase [Candidatus Atribacteria bacterium HGW-Atribacteria-1]
MKFLELVKTRQSVRKYLDKPVEREKIERCLEAARLAPSANNSQPWSFIVIDDPKPKEAVAEKTFDSVISFNRFSLQAPVLILIISERPSFFSRIGGAVKDKQFSLIDIGITAEHLCLQATEEGLGTCMLGWFNEKGVKKLLNIPPSKRVELIITMGYPESNQIRPKKRKPIDQIRSYNSYWL